MTRLILRDLAMLGAVGTLVLIVTEMTGCTQKVEPAIPHLAAWQDSPHAKADAYAFNHWNDEGEIEEACARCHATPGYQDYLGADGSSPWKVDQPAPVGTVIECTACHNEVTRTLDFVTFPSGARIEPLGDQARCMTCHQGRNSTDSVDEALAGRQDDVVDPELEFINIHYRAAAATRFGTEARGGYEYGGSSYAGYYLHDEDSQTCMDCHDPHTTENRVAACTSCHEGVQSKEDFVAIREMSGDFDGDGDDREGIAREIETMHEALDHAIRDYAGSVAGSPIVYSADHFPYFFADQDGDGQLDEVEAHPENRYTAWTPRLLRAAYNHQFIAQDPGAYTHNPVYALQLLHDSLADLDNWSTVAMDGMRRP